MSATEDRRVNAYSDPTSLTQAMLDETFRGGENQIEAIAILTKTVGATTYTLRFADRPKYVGDNFYEGRIKFPAVKRTIGELQTDTLQFSEVEVEIANIDGYLNQYLEGGANFFSFIGARLQIQIGLRDVSGSFITVFDGFVPQDDGFANERDQFRLRARDKFDILNQTPSLPYINATDFPSAPPESLGKVIPFGLGDWQAGYGYVVGASTASMSDGSGGTVSVIADSPSGFFGGMVGLNVGGGSFVFAVGTYLPDDAAVVHIKRGDAMIQTNLTTASGHNVLDLAGYWGITVATVNKVGGGTCAYVYQSGDVAILKIKIPYASGKYSNAIEIAQEVLKTLAGMSSGDFDSTWATLAAKSTPAQSAMATLKCRVWYDNNDKPVIQLARDILEMYRCEMFVNAAGKLSVKTLHPEDFPDPTTIAKVDQTEIGETDLRLDADTRTYFNEAQIDYGFCPVTRKTELTTPTYYNATGQTDAGKPVAKAIDCGWIYVNADANYQVVEFVRFYSGGLSYITAPLAWNHLLRDLGDFLAVTYNVGSLSYNGVPMQVRDISIDLATGSPTIRFLSFATFSYSTWSPSNAARFLSGAAQTIAPV